jgi:hypothetical protein
VEWASIYRHIPIPTDDSEVVWVGVNHGLALAKKHGSEVTVVTELLGSQSLPINCQLLPLRNAGTISRPPDMIRIKSNL